MAQDKDLDTDVHVEEVAEQFPFPAETELPNALVILPPAPVLAPVVEEKRVNFYQYAAGIPGIEQHHLPGLKAFIRNPEQLRTHKQWEALLAAY